MADEAGPSDQDAIQEGGIARIADKVKRKKAKSPPTPPNDVEHARWWGAYRAAPTHGVARLASHVRANIYRVRKAVHEGWPELGIVAFKTRALTADPMGRDALGRVTAEVQTQAIAQVAKLVIGTWEDAARAQLASLNSATSALTKLAAKLEQEADGASFVSYRRVPDMGEDGKPRRDEKGNTITALQAFTSGHAVAMAAARLAVAAKDHAMLGKVLLASIAPPARDEGAPGRDPRTMTSLQIRARIREYTVRSAAAGFEDDEATQSS